MACWAAMNQTQTLPRLAKLHRKQLMTRSISEGMLWVHGNRIAQPERCRTPLREAGAVPAHAQSLWERLALCGRCAHGGAARGPLLMIFFNRSRPQCHCLCCARARARIGALALGPLLMECFQQNKTAFAERALARISGSPESRAHRCTRSTRSLSDTHGSAIASNSKYHHEPHDDMRYFFLLLLGFLP
jgi:hypothetical protein